MENYTWDFLSNEENIERREGRTFILRKPFYCKDGFKMSIQASSSHYSLPFSGETNVLITHVEITCKEQQEFEPFLNDEEKEENLSVYSYVPIDIVDRVIEKRGGAKFTGTEIKFVIEKVEDTFTPNLYACISHEIDEIYYTKWDFLTKLIYEFDIEIKCRNGESLYILEIYKDIFYVKINNELKKLSWNELDREIRKRCHINRIFRHGDAKLNTWIRALKPRFLKEEYEKIAENRLKELGIDI